MVDKKIRLEKLLLESYSATPINDISCRKKGKILNKLSEHKRKFAQQLESVLPQLIADNLLHLDVVWIFAEEGRRYLKNSNNEQQKMSF